MCYHHEEEWPNEGHNNRTPPPNTATTATSSAKLENLSRRLADTAAQLAEARAIEAALSHQLSDMKRFVSVMEILESYIKRRFREEQAILLHLLASVSQ